jgi:hypothetical protein
MEIDGFFSKPYLLEAFNQARDKSGYVITLCRKKNTNLRTCFKRIICKAHLKPWPKLFQNLRSSRETELTEKFPLHVVCAWLGNSQLVAAKHYLQVTEDHFKNAIIESTTPNTPNPKHVA